MVTEARRVGLYIYVLSSLRCLAFYLFVKGIKVDYELRWITSALTPDMYAGNYLQILPSAS